MALIRPRLTDHYGIHLAQEEIDFVIPYLDEDIPFYVDPFLLWKSPSQQDTSLHNSLINSVNHMVYLANNGKSELAVKQIVAASECPEVGLGYSATRQGKRLGEETANKLVLLLQSINQLKENGFSHIEEMQFLLDQISKDRISDIACSYLKSFLIDYTIDQCEKHKIPLSEVVVNSVFDNQSNMFEDEKTMLPINPISSSPLLLVPKRWLRKVPWINYDSYVYEYLPKIILEENELHTIRSEILTYNRENYGVVSAYIEQKERTAKDCQNDPLFSQMPILSVKRKFGLIRKIPIGKEDNADKKYEDGISQLLASILYPHLDFASEQSRTITNVLIRDLIFYNNRSIDFFDDIFVKFESRQIVFELKNVKEVSNDHLDQLNRYLTNEFGKFGIIVTRNPPPKKVMRNTIDLWSGQRRCIIFLNDEDIELMVTLYESRQRQPYEVIAKKYVEFIRLTPS